jgi:hypothetical protein
MGSEIPFPLPVRRPGSPPGLWCSPCDPPRAAAPRIAATRSGGTDGDEGGLALRRITLGKRVVTADTALRLARFFGTSDRFWLNLQAAYDLDVERDRLGGRLVKEVEVLRRAS